MVEKRMKHNSKLMHKRKEQEREDNKLILAQENSVKHRWIDLC